MWSLGYGSGIMEGISNSTFGTIGSITYAAGPNAIVQSAMKFSGTHDSDVSIDVAHTLDFYSDYSIRFYAYLDNASSSGTILHYKSDYNGTYEFIKEFKIDVLDGNIRITFTNYGSATYSAAINAGEWNNIIYERDLSKPGAKVWLNNVDMSEATINDTMQNIPTTSPGIVHLGGDIDGTNTFAGRIACVQLVGCKRPDDPIYDQFCETPEVPLTTAITASTDMPITSTTGLTMSSLQPAGKINHILNECSYSC